MPRKLTKSQKEDVAAKQQFKCANSISDYECPLWQKENDKGIFGEEKYNIDHIKEIADGGTDDINNLQALCLSCHAVKTKRNKSLRAKAIREKSNESKKSKINFEEFIENINCVLKKDDINYELLLNLTDNRSNLIPAISKPVNMINHNKPFFIKNKINFDKNPINVKLKVIEETDSTYQYYKGRTFNDFKKIFNDILKSKLDIKPVGNTVNFILQDVIDKRKINKVDEVKINSLF